MRQVDGKSLIVFFVTCVALSSFNLMDGTISSYSQNDPYPVFSTNDPHDFLDRNERLNLQKIDHEPIGDRFSLRFSPFGQNATDAKNICKNTVCLGDINGRFSMIGLLHGELPEGKALPASLQTAYNVFYSGMDCTVNTETDQQCAPSPLDIDKCEQFGFFKIPLEYRKRGLRFDFLWRVAGPVGVRVQVGVADICQRLCDDFINLTPCDPSGCGENTSCATTDCSDQTINNILGGDTESGSFNPNNPSFTKKNIDVQLMCNLKTIAKELCYDIDNFQVTSVEDIRPSIFIRQPFLVNGDLQGWPEFLFIPFATIEGSIPVGKERDFSKLFGLSFGSNDHYGLGGTAGFNIDFTNSIELGCEVGVTHFFERDVCRLPMPTSCYQQGIFPFKTNACVQPGRNWHFGAKMSAYHFLERLSFYFQYILVQHDPDCIKLKKADPAFLPGQLEKISGWKVQVANISFNYDISPNFCLGLLWQAPLSQRNTYRSTSVLWCTLNTTF
jgi:hypothetical protein